MVTQTPEAPSVRRIDERVAEAPTRESFFSGLLHKTDAKVGRLKVEEIAVPDRETRKSLEKIPLVQRMALEIYQVPGLDALTDMNKFLESLCPEGARILWQAPFTLRKLGEQTLLARIAFELRVGTVQFSMPITSSTRIAELTDYFRHCKPNKKSDFGKLTFTDEVTLTAYPSKAVHEHMVVDGGVNTKGFIAVKEFATVRAEECAPTRPGGLPNTSEPTVQDIGTRLRTLVRGVNLEDATEVSFAFSLQ